MKRALLLAALAVVLPAIVYAQTTGDQFADPAVPDIIPRDDGVGPVANTVAEFKFDDGFYEKISRIMEEPPLPGDPGVFDGARYYNVILVVSRGDGPDPDMVARENKDALVERLEALGARDIAAAESLSFVTASIPVAEVPGFSLHDEVFKLGDGELPVFPEVDVARTTVDAAVGQITAAAGKSLDGSGVRVAVIDTGINHSRAFNGKIADRILCTVGNCMPFDGVIGRVSGDQLQTTHGTKVAQVIAASGLAANNGIAPEVELLDVMYTFFPDAEVFVNVLAHALDWSLLHGADIVNMSLGLRDCFESSPTAFSLIVNEAVDKGMVVIKSAGNENDIVRNRDNDINTVEYRSISNPGCGYNVISVGGINDRNPNDVRTSWFASRGPAGTSMLLKPDLAAPASEIVLLSHVESATNTVGVSGTSFATPQVSATAALLLQAKPELTPLQIRSALLLGASWQGGFSQGPDCTSAIYETADSNNPCSHARQPVDRPTANNAASLRILNNVGFGVLNVSNTIRYATSSDDHIMMDHLDSDSSKKWYKFTVDDMDEQVKIILSWMVHPHGNVTSHATGNAVVPIADLDFVTWYELRQLVDAASGTSDEQVNEFAVFTPQRTGTYYIMVSGSGIDDLNKPFQVFTLASTVPLEEYSPRSNTPPTAVAQDIVAGPDNMPRVVRLTSADPDDEPRSYHVSRDPTSGILSTAEVITKSTSRALYTPNPGFTGDTFEITPYDGKAKGSPVTVTVRAENLPTGATEGTIMPDTAGEDRIDVTGEARHSKYTKSFGAKSYPVHHIRVGSSNMEGVVAEITAGSETYRIAVPAGGSRIIDLASPLQVSSAKLTAWVEEEAAHDLNNMEASTINAYIQYAATSCPGAGDNAQASCRAPGRIGPPTVTPEVVPDLTSDIFFDDFESGDGKWDETGEGDWRIVTPPSQYVPLAPGNTPNNHVMHVDDCDTLCTITMLGPVDLTRYKGAELVFERFVSSGLDYNDYAKVELYDGSKWNTVYHWTHGNGDDSMWHEETYDLGSYLGVDDFKVRFVAKVSYFNEDVQIDDVWIRSTFPPVESLYDDFESGLDKWWHNGTGWTTSTSPEHYVPVVRDHSTANKVLHIDAAASGAVITTKVPVDLTSAPSPVLKFWRFVDSSLDADEYLKVEIYDGSEWDTIYHWSENLGGNDHRWHRQTFDLGEYRIDDFKVRFTAQMSKATEDVQIDDLEISRVGGTSAPIVDPTTPRPAAVCVHPPSPHSIYVSNTDDGQVRAYSPTGTYLGLAVPTYPSDRPWDVAFDSDNNIYVADFANNKIRKYDGSSGREINRDWASTQFSPSSLVWNNDTLYVGTAGGVERFSATGSPLGAFGDARERPSDSSIPRLYSAFDVLFAHERMYVSDKSLNKVYYYNATDGRYLGKIPGMGSPAPLVTRPHGLECDGSTVLYQAADSVNRVNKINATTGSLIKAIRSMVDNPHGIDADADGNVFVANKDDDNILKITRTDTVSVLISDRALDDPRGVTVGPVYSRATEGTAGADLGDPPNDSPYFEVLLDGDPVYGIIPVSSAVTFEVRVTDTEGDPITITMDPGHIPDDEAISITDRGDGTASISLDPEGIPPGMYKFAVTVSDPENEEVSSYVVDIR